MVTSSFGSRELRVTIQVNDVNDPPVFPVPSYNVTVREDTTINTRFLTISASDADQSFGILTYSFTEVTGTYNFKVAFFVPILVISGIIFYKQISSNSIYII